MSGIIAPSLIPGAKIAKKKKPSGFRPVARPKPAPKASKPGNSAPKPSILKKPPINQTKSLTKPAATVANPKKRKQPTSISAGSSRAEVKDTKKVTDDEEPENEDVPAEESPKRKPLAFLLPAEPAYVDLDKEILEKLRAEDPETARLNSFCTPFKCPKRARKDKEEVAERKERADEDREEPEPQPDGAPVVQIIDGEIVLQESSLLMPRQRKTVQEVEEEYEEVVHEDDHPAIVGASYNSFVSRKKPQHWTIDETKTFYNALRQVGPDFCSMEAYFENRNRKQLKRKYKSELTKNPRLVEMALDPRYKADIDLSVFNVEVDPMAIEAAARDEPPKYEPTDVEESEGKTPKKADKAVSQQEWEEVFEDAQEEARKATKSRSKGNSTLAMAVISQEQPSLWPTLDEIPEEEDHHDVSMDDFFHDIDPVADDSHVSSGPVPKQAKLEPVSTSISLVPKKAAGKTKRPKFKSSARKRK